mmetsp:Transcript_32351/g.100092  ORF Transcript_32351/g.100092 Transcript_32351/m.100092 type:complete len:153 (-) Transcript_32351:231-689(-)
MAQRVAVQMPTNGEDHHQFVARREHTGNRAEVPVRAQITCPELANRGAGRDAGGGHVNAPRLSRGAFRGHGLADDARGGTPSRAVVRYQQVLEPHKHASRQPPALAGNHPSTHPYVAASSRTSPSGTSSPPGERRCAARAIQPVCTAVSKPS